MAEPLYKGFSSFEYQKTKTFRLTDVELVKLDLLNHIFTRRGERVMMPNFGTGIPDLVFEPLDAETLETLEDELRTVFDFDPRVEILQLDIRKGFDGAGKPNGNAVTASARVLFIELNIVDNFDLNIIFEE